MLGRHHLSISVFTVLPFIIPLFFLNTQNVLVYSIALLVAVVVGSLLPDSDCGGKPKLYYDFGIIYDLMIPIQKIVVFLFKLSGIKKRLNLQYEVNHEHRGIMHSPIGILISSLLLTLVVLIFMLIGKFTNLITLSLIFAGLVIGQLLHILEDSCTVSGINWKFPFGTKELKGRICTFEKQEGKVDIRAGLYQNILGGFSFLLLLGFSFKLLDFSPYLIYLGITLIIIALWFFFYSLSKSGNNIWYRDKEKVMTAKRNWNRMQRNLVKNSFGSDHSHHRKKHRRKKKYRNDVDWIMKV
ncbi:MAG: metal-dependent hydrolase [Nanoarchaeota archaeon]|nr:metal-dependent hydrolase [Nanoarchaeota archaeon]MBU1051283.1 metal-dependent hydrolase [Nanoarchaeota archaeon]